MPSPFPRYEENVPKDHCRVRCCNDEGEDLYGQKAAFPYAHNTIKSQGVVKRKPIFSYDRDHTYSLLEPVFKDLGNGADHERLSERTQRMLCKLLDRCDLEAVDYHNCQGYVDELLAFCSEITRECTGRSLGQWGIFGEAELELRKAWMHFVRLIWIRDFEWENMVRCLSDPNAQWSVSEDYFLEDPAQTVRYAISEKLMVPLQVWAFMLKTVAEHEAQNAPARKRSYV
eukprot:gb/GFBE01051618.1/.p1 GENE.gb/GFBE01051618.1/~~gb/GFBE01051618.1/.p1  ORF type:complete len:229 (+),score=45.74 gb/GFBE01051618.1/:1-687(+)